ncbi:MAG: hypothetical protein IJR86_04865 [Bacteroidaceae bacterium]|nr:hypothetical protein [Bacteroidaceae bacterium]
MKISKIFKLSCFAMAATMVFASCSSDEDLNKSVATTDYDNAELLDLITTNAQPTILTENDYTVEEFADQIFGADGSNASEEQQAAKAKFLATEKVKADSMANVLGQNGITKYFKKITYTYPSIDENGKTIQLSALVTWGYWKMFGKSFNLDQDNMVLYCPYTHTLNSECATVSGGGNELTLLTEEVLMIMPDYEGFGQTNGRDQVYLNHSLCARHIVDALAPGYQIFKNNNGTFEKDYKFIIMGASQGGANTIATLKYMENNFETRNGVRKSLANWYSLDHVDVCCGPYSPATTMQKYYEWGKVSFPVAFPLVIKSMIACYPDVMAGVKESDFYSASYLAHKSEFDNIFKNKTKKVSDINELMIKYCATAAHKKSDKDKLYLSDFMSAAGQNMNSDIMKKLTKCLEKNELTTGWIPQHKIDFYCSEGDEVVPYENSLKMISFAQKYSLVIAIDYSETVSKSHTASCAKWMAKKFTLHNM